MTDVKKTITSIFMVPTLGITRDNLLKNGFINGYSKDGKRDVQYEDCIYVVFKPSSLDTFRDFLDGEYERTKKVVDDYDYPDGYVVVVYQLDEKFKRDFEYVKTGKYSKTSKEFQNMFPKTVKIFRNGRHIEEKSLQHRVFEKTSDLKEYWESKIGVDFDDDMELWGIYKEDDETLDIDKLKQHV